MTPEQLALLLEQEESAHLEFKERVDLESKEGKADFLREVMALANSSQSASFLIIGVENKTKKLVGVSDFTEEQVQQIAAEHCKPPIPFSYSSVSCKGTLIGVVEIYRSNLKPHTFKTRYTYQGADGKQKIISEKHVFVRRGSTIDEATPDEIVEMAQDREESAELMAQGVAELEKIEDHLAEVTYIFRERTDPFQDDHTPDRIIEGTFISVVAGGLLAWLWGSGASFSLLFVPVLCFAVSIVAAALKIVRFDFWRALFSSLCHATQILDSVVKQLYSSRKGFLDDQETPDVQSRVQSPSGLGGAQRQQDRGRDLPRASD
jgi:hypothetical protein